MVGVGAGGDRKVRGVGKGWANLKKGDCHYTGCKELSSHIGSYIRLKICFEFLQHIFVNKVVCHILLNELFANSSCLSQFCVKGQSIFC